MRYLIPAAAILVLGIIGSSRRSVEAPKASPTLAGGIVEATPSPGVSEIARDSRSAVPEPAVSRSGDPLIAASVASDPSPDVPASEIQEMLDLLRTRLGLGAEQEPRVKDALRQRIRDLQACQQAYRDTGVFVPAEYGRQLIRLKETWFRNIDGVLDSEQHHLFVQLLNNGLFRPGTEFAVDLSTMTVLR